MGYDYRSSGSSPVGSIAPIGGAAYDITDTVKAYTARVPASKLILGVPYYGRAWSTRQRQAQRQEHQWHEVRRVQHGDLRQRHHRPAGARQALRHRRGRRLDGLPPRELFGHLRLRHVVAAAVHGRCLRAHVPSTTSSTTTACAAPGSGRSATTTRAPSCGPRSRTSSSARRRSLTSTTSPTEIEWLYTVRHHRRLRAHPVLPQGQGHPRPDGDVPRPRAGPARRDDRLLRRRRRQDRRRQHQRPGQGQDHRRLRPAPLLPDGLGHPRPDGDVPRPRPGPAQRARPTTSTTTTARPARSASTRSPCRASPAAAATAATARPAPSRASRWPPSCTAPTCRAASTEHARLHCRR